jgi:hypothetical protein
LSILPEFLIYCRESRRRGACAAALAVTLAATLSFDRLANAGTWDLNLSRLCRLQAADGTLLDCGRPHDFSQYGGLSSDPIKPDHESFRSLMSELAVIFAPNLSAPAETVGFGGFNLSADFGFTTINPRRSANHTDATLKHRYWRAAESVSGEAYRTGSDIRTGFARERIDAELPPDLAPTMTLMARKGFWFPFPSVEFGAGVKHLIGSQMWAGIITAKVALHEGFQSWPLPAIALRGSGTRVFGGTDFDLTLAGLDLSISKAFGLGSTYSLTPYLGYQLLWIIADSATLDALPYQRAADLSNDRHFTFLPQARILRQRAFIGARLQFYMVTLLAHFSFFVPGTDDQTIRTATLRTVEVEDRAGAQYSLNLSLGVDF